MIQGAWTRNAEDLKRNLELLARQHVAYFALEFGPQVVLDFDPKMAEGGRFAKAQAREIIDHGRRLGLKPIAYLELLGHLERAYKKEPYTHEGGIDIRSDAAYEKFVHPILTEMLDVYGPVEYFHCGMDEAVELFSWLSKEHYDAADLLARHIKRINRFLKARGVKMVIWHDMLTAPSLAKELGARLARPTAARRRTRPRRWRSCPKTSSWTTGSTIRWLDSRGSTTCDGRVLKFGPAPGKHPFPSCIMLGTATCRRWARCGPDRRDVLALPRIVR